MLFQAVEQGIGTVGVRSRDSWWKTKRSTTGLVTTFPLSQLLLNHMSSSRQSQLLLNHNSTPQSQKEAGAPLTNSFDGKHRANTARPSPTPWRVCSRLCVFNKHSLTSGKIVTGPLHGWSRPPGHGSLYQLRALRAATLTLGPTRT